MFYSESLLSKDGPLAQVWLAANLEPNLERKLNKSQFLQSNIIQSTQAIVKATSTNANTSNNSNNSSSGSDDSEAIALRLSGQLLYGVVRIYSRKAKYLLDDVSDALLKLKTAFKSSVQSVTLPINATVVPSVTQLMLQDTITHTDLLYQEPLVFDDEPGSGSGFFGGSSQGAFANRSTQDFDDSIEIPRNKFNDMDELQEDDGFELDLNFDIDEGRGDGDDELAASAADDESIEMGRAIDEGFNLSAIDNIEEGQFDAGFDAGFDDFNFDEETATAADFFDQPLELIDEPTNDATSKETQIEAAAAAAAATKIKAPRKQRVSTAGQRKIVVDKDIEIPVSDFSTTDSTVIKNTSRTERFELQNKRSFIQSVLSQNFNFNDKLALSPSKRQKTTAASSSSSSTDDIEHGFDLDLPELDHSGLDHPQEEEDRYDNVDFGVWGEDDHHAAQQQEQAQEQEEEEDDFTNSFGSSKDGISESTLKISRHIQTITSQSDNSKTTFTEILNHDIQSIEPLSSKP
ncbi:hypothetical protein WICPIJ_009391, partial [Wickerhamomyces pijperi]